MTLTRNLLACLALSVATSSAFAAVPNTNSAPAPSAPAPAVKGKKGTAQPAPASSPAPTTNAPAPTEADILPQKSDTDTKVKFDSYIKDLTSDLKLSDSEAKQITAYYVADADKVQEILNDDTISPLQQAQQVANLRDARNEKIEELLHDFQRQQEFLKVEAQYRVALTELAADGGLVAPAPPAPPPAAPAPAPAAPAAK